MSANKISQLSEEYIKERIATVPYWWHRIEVAPGIFTPGNDDTPARKEQFRLPKDMRGKRVLDIGAYEGFFSFECERRGGAVTAMDVIGPNQSGFSVVHELLGSKIKHVKQSVYNLNPEEMGEFEIVLFLGVLYHLRHPLLALDRIYTVCKDLMILESQICDAWFLDQSNQPVFLKDFSTALTDIPLAQFYPYDELCDDPSNWWAPNLAALTKMIETSGFEPELVFTNGVRAIFHCRKKAGRPPWVAYDAAVEDKLPDMIERTSPRQFDIAANEKFQAVSEELQLARVRLAAIENTRTWRWASKISYSPFGRALSRAINSIAK